MEATLDLREQKFPGRMTSDSASRKDSESKDDFLAEERKVRKHGGYVRFLRQQHENERKCYYCPVLGAVVPTRKRTLRVEVPNENNDSVVLDSERSDELGKRQKRKLIHSKTPHVDRPELPERVKEKIQELEGSEVKLVIQKELFSSDLSPNNGRFSIPIKQIRKEGEDFLTEEEEQSMDVYEREKHDGQKKPRLQGLPVLVFDPCLRECNLCLKKWNMERTSVYNLTRGWNTIVRDNRLKAKDTVQLWSFRRNHQLCFALVKL